MNKQGKQRTRKKSREGDKIRMKQKGMQNIKKQLMSDIKTRF